MVGAPERAVLWVSSAEGARRPEVGVAAASRADEGDRKNSEKLDLGK
jgi:hypothetical protein